MQHHLMAAQGEVQPTRQAIDRTLEIAVIERHKKAAALAEQVMVMLAGGIDQLVPGGRIPQLQPLDELPFLQQLKNPIDARPRDSAVLPP